MSLSRGSVFILVALASAALLAAGCGSGQDARTRELLLEANDHLSKAAAAVGELAGFQKSWEALLKGQEADTAQAVQKLRILLESALANEQEALSQLNEAEKALLAAKEQPVSRDMKNYLVMKLEALAEQRGALQTELKAMPLRMDVLSAVESGATIDQVIPLLQEIDQLETESRDQFMKAGAMHRDANDYYDEKKLGK